MALRISTGLVNEMMANQSFKSALEAAPGGLGIKIFTGSRPATPDSTPTGTLLVTVTSAGAGINFEASADNGTLEKEPTETWSGTVVADGTAGWFRMCGLTDTGGASTTEVRVDGTVGTSGADMNLTSLSLTTGTPITLSDAQFTLPKA